MNQENEKNQEIEKLLEKKARIEKKLPVVALFTGTWLLLEEITEHYAENFYENASGFFLAISFFLLPICLYFIISLQLINIKIHSITCEK